jgi:hypothetical protein
MDFKRRSNSAEMSEDGQESLKSLVFGQDACELRAESAGCRRGMKDGQRLDRSTELRWLGYLADSWMAVFQS